MKKVFDRESRLLNKDSRPTLTSTTLTVFILTVTKKWGKATTLQSGGLHLLKFLRHTISEFVFILRGNKNILEILFSETLSIKCYKDIFSQVSSLPPKAVLAKLCRQDPTHMPQTTPIPGLPFYYGEISVCYMQKSSITPSLSQASYIRQSLLSRLTATGLTCICQVAYWPMKFLIQLKTTYLLK